MENLSNTMYPIQERACGKCRHTMYGYTCVKTQDGMTYTSITWHCYSCGEQYEE